MTEEKDRLTIDEAVSETAVAAVTEQDINEADSRLQRLARTWTERGWNVPASASPELARAVAAEAASQRDRPSTKEPQAPIYIDVAQILDGTHKAPTTSVGGRREDGVPLLYAAAVNILFGAPEAGKTLVAGAMANHELEHDGRVLWIDLDHNGAPALLARMQALGTPPDVLVDRARFRLALPEDADAIMNVLQDCVGWPPTLVVVDSIGELLPLFGAKTNDSDDYTDVHRRVLAATARLTGAAVLAIDHEAKSVESRNYGAAGTMAKKRAVDGALLRVVNIAPFVPGLGGEAQLAVVKDRHGALRTIAEGSREPTVARFVLLGPEHDMTAQFALPLKRGLFSPDDDVALLSELQPPPSSVRDVKRRMGWGSDKASAAFRTYRERSGNTTGIPVPVFPTPSGGNAGTPHEELQIEPDSEEQQ